LTSVHFNISKSHYYDSIAAKRRSYVNNDLGSDAVWTLALSTTSDRTIAGQSGKLHQHHDLLYQWETISACRIVG